MRFVLVFIIWILFVGGLYLYTSGRDAAAIAARERAPVAVEQTVEHTISVELTPTFSIEEDPFALKTDAQTVPIEIRLNGMPLTVESDEISRGKTLIVQNIPVRAAEHNELFVKASPPMNESSLDHGIRVRLLEEARVLAESTIWSSGGGLVSGSVSFELSDEEEANDH